ncbi:MAG: hypothetical protein C4523_21535 [Myxococcales bacterium]|nr:MAG: hypothetical protein C4523_21535 [Myxococcales bacterium]
MRAVSLINAFFSFIASRRPQGFFPALFSLVLSLSLFACGAASESGQDIPVFVPPDGDEVGESDSDGVDADLDFDANLDGDSTPAAEDEAAIEDGDSADEPEQDAAEEDTADGDNADIEFGDSEPESADGDQDRPAGFCLALGACEGQEVCNLALGRCEWRELVPAQNLELLNFAAPASGAGDMLVIDGKRFYASLFGAFSVRVSIGSTPLSNTRVDENRITVPVPADVSGRITVTGENGTVTSTDPLLSAGPGVLPCDESTPAASGEAGATPAEAGPYASAHLDLVAEGTDLRLTYPALCGGLRRPPAEGTYPLVVLLHGDGGQYLNYEYLAQHLATWGFISIMPETDATQYLQEAVKAFQNVSLNTFSEVLDGLHTTASVALVGHSRGAERLQDVASDTAIGAETVASVFLGPVYDNDGDEKMPGMFMTFSATGDLQSNSSFSEGAYASQSPPKWYIDIKGGNHSLFTDHKVWLGAWMDLAPTITRREQFAVIVSFVLPLFQRAFGLDEPFADWLDNPPASALYSVVAE